MDPNLRAALLVLSRPGLENNLLMATRVRPARPSVLLSAQAGPLEMMPLAVSMTDVVCRCLVPLVSVPLQVNLGSTVV